MAAKVNLVLGANGRDNSERLLARYREVAAGEVGAAVWIAPTERVRDEVLEMIARSAGAVLAPQVETFPSLAAQLCGVGPASHVIPVPHQRMILAQLLAELHKANRIPLFGPSVEFPGFVDEVFGFISELKGLGVAPAEFDEFAAQRNQGHGMTPKDREIGLIYSRYSELFAQHGFVDRESQYALASKRLETRLGVVSGTRAVFVDGFVAFTPPQLHLMRGLAGQVEELWIALPLDEADTDRAELYATATATLAELHQQFENARAVAPADSQASRRPRGLVAVDRQLFREEVERTADASGWQLIEAPGIVGEVRMAARAIKDLLHQGSAPADVLVCTRDMAGYGELLAEIFAEYGIPLDVETSQSLADQPMIASLLAAAQLDVEDWPFAPTTALLRSTLFRPDWPEEITDESVVADAEILLRLLGETRQRDHYLSAVRRIANEPEMPLEDEEESGASHRKRHELAKRCLPFVERFFSAWDDAPQSATFTEHVKWLQTFTEKMGFNRDEADNSAFARLWHELERWSVREKQMHGDGAMQNRARFLARLGEVAAAVSVMREEPMPGCVRAVPADLAPALRYEHLFLLGLGEGSFPRLGDHGPLYDAAERNGFRAVGLDLRGTEGRLADEMSLFHRLIGGAAKSVTLSYPAIDEKGQRLLPGTFPQNVVGCFVAGAIPVTRRQMLVEGVDSQPPYSNAEYRVRWAAERQFAKKEDSAAARPMDAHLLAVEEMARARFRDREFGAFDGMIVDANARAEIATHFGSRKKYSATALEDYIACPFRFFMRHVLDLEPLDDPAEEIAANRRGIAIHRALAQLHRKAKAPKGDIAERLIQEIESAVAAEAQRGSSQATKMLWQLESDRLRRMAGRYAEHWREFLSWWSDLGISPAPSHVEAKFSASGSMAVDVAGEVLHLAGRIDRIDTATLADGTLAFWVFDYKTGSTAMSSSDAATLVKLQLAIYALAAESILGGDASARPVGLAYWMVAGSGVQPVSTKRAKTAWHDAPDHWQSMKARLIPWLGAIVKRIRAGEFPLQPRHEKKSCESCSFDRACRINQSRRMEKAWELPLPVVDAEA